MSERFAYRDDREAYNVARVKALESLLVSRLLGPEAFKVSRFMMGKANPDERLFAHGQ